MVTRRESGTALVAGVLAAAAALTVLPVVAHEIGRQRSAFGASLDRQRASAVATSRLERLTAPDETLAVGTRAFDTETPGLEGEERVLAVAPGLLDVSVRVWAANAEVRRATRVATERP
jgi:hypothetical protein